VPGCAAPRRAGTVVDVTVSADTFDPSVLDDRTLADLAAMIAAEQRERAVAAADPDALVELGFSQGFTGDGMPRDPWLVNGVLVCTGTRIDRSATGHDCGFVSVGGSWVWEADDLLADVVRHLPGPKSRMRAVSLVAAYDGLELDLVVSRARAGVHQMKSARSFVVRDGALVLVTTRTPRVPDHRR
jgi:hypothetical protein